MNVYQTHLILSATGENDLRFKNGNTGDIINVIVEADSKAAPFTQKFAPTLKGKTLFETCRNLHRFVKTQIRYKIDPPGEQWIKSPGRLWKDKIGDCKSFSLFIGSCLKNLGIPYGYRFTSYDVTSSTPTHVYVYVPQKNGEIILDAVWQGPFNTQKPYAHKTDKLMPTKISYLGSTQDGHIAGTLVGLPKDYHDMAEGEFELYLARQRAEIEEKNHSAIGSPYTGRWAEARRQLDYAIANINNPDAIIGMADDMIGKAKAKGKTNKGGGLLKKIGQGIKKGVKAVTKVVTAPVRLIAKGALEIYLPNAAPAFLYLFTPPGAKLPDVMARKKAKAEKFKKFIVQKISMKEPHFMGIIRNALTKRFGKSPESYLQERLATRVSGIAGNNKKKTPQRKAKVIKKTGPAVKKAPVTAAMLKEGLPAAATMVTQIVKPQNVSPTSDVKEKKGFFKGAEGIVENAASGNLVGAVMSAITWLISKLGGKKEDALTAEDLPDIEKDASNAFEWQDMKEDFSNVTPTQKAQTKEVATELIEQIEKLPAVKNVVEKIEEKVKEKLPFLNDKQAKEVAEEIQEGPEALDEDEGRSLGYEIKTQGQPVNDVNVNNGGGTRGGICGC